MTDAKQLFDEASAGRKLTAYERRHVIGFLQGSADTSYSNTELARILQVHESQIRQDKIKIKKKMIEVLQDDHNVESIITDILIDYNKVQKELEKGLKVAKLGRMEHLRYSLAIMDVRLRVTEVFQGLGWFPKSLGTIHEEKFVWKTIVGSDGKAETQRIESVKEKKVKPEKLLIEKNITPISEKKLLKEEQSEFSFVTSSEEDKDAKRSNSTTPEVL